jgi:indolepyruvate ferredoxin oxidoreductase beta subunit
MQPFNIYLTGVGGQGIGLISEILLRAADHAGLVVKGVDTHGLAQRGGIVVSQLRIGGGVQTPLIREFRADLVVALERYEALRAVGSHLKADNYVLVYYDTVWQPLAVRLRQEKEVSIAEIEAYCEKHRMAIFRVQMPELVEARMQNITVLACIAHNALVAGVSADHYRQAMADLMQGTMLEKNLALFNTRSRGSRDND